MKITKTYLRQIIQEEIAKIKENQPAERKRGVSDLDCVQQGLCIDGQTGECVECDPTPD